MVYAFVNSISSHYFNTIVFNSYIWGNKLHYPWCCEERVILSCNRSFSAISSAILSPCSPVSSSDSLCVLPWTPCSLIKRYRWYCIICHLTLNYDILACCTVCFNKNLHPLVSLLSLWVWIIFTEGQTIPPPDPFKELVDTLRCALTIPALLCPLSTHPEKAAMGKDNMTSNQSSIVPWELNFSFPRSLRASSESEKLYKIQQG